MFQGKALCNLMQQITARGSYPCAAVSRQRFIASQPKSIRWVSGSAEPEPQAKQEDAPRTERRPAAPNNWINETVRGSQASEAILLGFYKGQRQVRKGNHPDIDYFETKEEQLLLASDDMVLRYRVRPSLLRPLACGAGYAIGLGSALAGRTVSFAAAGAMRDVAEEHYNDAVRHIMEDPSCTDHEGLKKKLKEMRDADRAPEGSPRAPGIEALREPKDLTPMDAVGTAVRIIAEAVLTGARRL